MPPLATNLRRQLESAVSNARETAEAAAVAAMTAIGVESDARPGHLEAATNGLRLALRARGRTLGKGSLKDGLPALIEEVAYEQWHRMLFARFLAENRLLIEPGSGQPVSLKDCEELAQEEGIDDPWLLAASFASEMLPGIFRAEDPAVQLRLAPEGRAKLEAILAALPPDLFTADDALGWVYQFWQARKKDEVNKSGRKIGGEDIAPVTQLFTEHYMVRFLLENSLGAWWAARHPGSPLLKEWEYLRFRDDGTPAAGTFPGWPEQAKDVTVMDPCCGSGHFLVAAADMLRKMRMEEEGLAAADTAVAVLRDNLFGLELDPRCTQIAAFALAFDAWKAAGWRDLPLPNIACSGVAVGGSAKEWMDLAGDDGRLRYTLERLWELFKDAPDLGSLINPAQLAVQDRMFTTDYAEVAPVLRAALAKHGDDPAAAVFGAAAEGAARAGELLAGRYTLVATNPPFLSRGKQGEVLKKHAEVAHPQAKADLSTMFVERCRAFMRDSGGYTMVTPQNWLFLGSYKKLRERLLREQTWGHVARLGAGAFDTISGEVVSVTLVVLEQSRPGTGHEMTGIDAFAPGTSAEKARLLREQPVAAVEQATQLRNPNAKVTLEAVGNRQLLSRLAGAPRGIVSGDNAYWFRTFWEFPTLRADWRRLQSAPDATAPYTGRSEVVSWASGGDGMLRHSRANTSYRRLGVAVSQVGNLPATLYIGDFYDNSTFAIVPDDSDVVPALWAFCSSPDYGRAVRKGNSKLSVDPSHLVSVPFDRDYWQKEAARRYPDGLPAPHSDDPTQWLFKGNNVGSAAPLQVAVARLLGYRWPDQPAAGDPGIEPLDGLVDDDGIVCLPAVAGEQPAAERLRALLAAAHANPPSGPRPKGAPPWPTLPPRAHEWIEQLLASVGYAGKTLEDWLRDGFFEQHFKLFHQRPFAWHIDDGLRGKGFSALVNYHKLDGAKLDRLIYSYLQAYIDATKAQVDAGAAGADARLKAAVDLKAKLEAIRQGEPPYDIYVRWKKLHEQPIGWNPDLDDGVRLNIRPWMTAGVLRKNPNIKWGVDRGTNPDGTKRDNDVHLTRAEKEAARRAAGVSV
ncbi:MAG: N-6 DNA methylase [Dehalococcoidia bacterium]|nr:N-6 DNA methylase [Dehalococcoidia bacterium]